MNIHLRTCTRSLRSSTTSTSIGIGLSHGHVDVAGPSRTNFRRVSSSTSPLSARQYLGRITPKRIAVSRSSLDPSHPSYLPSSSSSSSSSSSYGSASGSYDGLPRRSIWRPIVFCTLFGGGSYTLLALYTNYDTQKWTDKLSKSSSMTSGVGWWKSSHVPSNREMQRAKQLEGAKSAQKTLNTLPTTLSFLPNIILVPILRMYVMGSEFYLNTPSSQLAPIGLIGGMTLVFLSWKVQRGRWQGFMRKWWLHHPVLIPSASGGPAGLNSIKRKEWASCVTLFTSTLSHQSLPHLAFNSLALFSFGSASYAYLSSSPSLPNLPTSTHTPHFLGFLLVAGLFSSLSSHIYTNLFRLPKLLKSLRSPGRLSSALALANQQSILPSLGASGAIYSALTLTALAFPDSNVGIIFLPFVKFPIGAGVAGMVALDLVGLIRGWRLFDHTAHLAGALFGVLYYGYGRQTWTWLRRQLDFSDTYTK